MKLLFRLVTGLLVGVTALLGVAPAQAAPSSAVREVVAAIMSIGRRKKTALYLLHARDYLRTSAAQMFSVVQHRNAYGKGVLTYEGTYLSDALQEKVVADCLAAAGVPLTDAALPAGVKAKHGVLADGAAVHAYFNFAGAPREFFYAGGSGRDLLTGAAVAGSRKVALAQWDCLIVRAESSK